MATTIEELRQRVQLERRLIARLKTANIRFTGAQVERIWAIVSAHQAGLSMLQRLERGESVVVNLRPDADAETEFVGFDRPRVVRVLERIAADLDNLSLVPNDPHADKESNNHDPQARRHKLAEPPPKPKKLSHREQRTALRASLGLPPQ